MAGWVSIKRNGNRSGGKKKREGVVISEYRSGKEKGEKIRKET